MDEENSFEPLFKTQDTVRCEGKRNRKRETEQNGWDEWSWRQNTY